MFDAHGLRIFEIGIDKKDVNTAILRIFMTPFGRVFRLKINTTIDMQLRMLEKAAKLELWYKLWRTEYYTTTWNFWSFSFTWIVYFNCGCKQQLVGQKRIEVSDVKILKTVSFCD